VFPKDVEVLTLRTWECDLIGNGVFPDDQVKMKLLERVISSTGD
jgi:hypothetical protein